MLYRVVAQDVDGPHFQTVAIAKDLLQFRRRVRLVPKGVRDEEKRVVPLRGDETVEFGEGKVVYWMTQKTSPEGHDMVPFRQRDLDTGVEFQLRIVGL